MQDTKSEIIAAPAGLGSGKTRGLVEIAIHRGWLNSPAPSMLIEPTFPMVRDVLEPALSEILDARHIRHRHNRSTHTYTLIPGGGVPAFDIRCRSAEKPHRLDGSNLGFVGIDEAGQVKAEAIDRARRRIRHPAARCRQLYLTGTPEGFGAFYEWAEGDKARATRLIRASSTENIFLPPGYVESTLGHLNEYEREQYVHGHFIAKNARVYWAFDKNTQVAPCDMKTAGRVVVGADFNVGKMVWILGTIVGETLFVWREIVGANTNSWEQCDKLKSAIREELGEYLPFSSVTIYPDASGEQRRTSSGTTDIAILRGQGFRVHVGASNPAVADRVYSVNGVARRGGLIVDPSCRETLRSLNEQGYHLDAPDKRGGLDHAGDALGYMVHGQPQWRANRPQGNGAPRQGGYL